MLVSSLLSTVCAVPLQGVGAEELGGRCPAVVQLLGHQPLTRKLVFVALLGAVDTKAGRVSDMGANLERFHRAAVLLRRSLVWRKTPKESIRGRVCVSGSRLGQRSR